MTKVLRFGCRLLSDVIINRKSATEGNNETLDFIPGNCFLGIVAGKLYDSLQDSVTKNLLFHSGKVRFGDAHPSKGNTRGLKVPALMYYPKLGKPSEELYIHSRIEAWDEVIPKQLKQCRDGFYVFGKDQAVKVGINKSFAIKSAYNRDTRRSEDSMMFGYESLPKGLYMIFEVELDDEAVQWAEQIAEALTGTRHIGRSRTAQYGLVDIVRLQAEGNVVTKMAEDHELVHVYADGRLIFFDSNGECTFRPTAEQLGLGQHAEIVWEKSQIRTFQYSPWNAKRQAFDVDRCGIEKGSVFVVRNAVRQDVSSTYVGSYRNEGFGKVLYDPFFLDIKKGSNGEALVMLVENDDDDKKKKDLKGYSDNLLSVLRFRKEQADMEEKAYKIVNTFVGENSNRFVNDKAFASQWGKIREIAVRSCGKTELYEELFTTGTGYLQHGVAKEKWEDNGRLEALRVFVDSLDENCAKFVMINLSAEMAKKCRRK